MHLKVFSFYKGFIFTGLAFFFISCLATHAHAQQTVSEKTARRWVKKGSWREGMPEKPSATINAVKFYTQYHAHQAWWDKALAFMKRNDLATMPTGKYPLDGDHVFAMINEYPPADTSQIKWEAHTKYADIQFLIRGKEKIGIASAASLQQIVPYNPSNDAANYAGPGKYVEAKPGTFFIFFPGEAHRPNLKTDPGDTAIVRKVVIKMRIP